MTENEIEQATEVFKSKITQWYDNKEKEKSAYTYEKSYIEAMQAIEKEVLELIVGTKAKSRNAKKKSKRW
jgi:hypothetical protein